jgi:hypothetical protein
VDDLNGGAFQAQIKSQFDHLASGSILLSVCILLNVVADRESWAEADAGWTLPCFPRSEKIGMFTRIYLPHRGTPNYKVWYHGRHSPEQWPSTRFQLAGIDLKDTRSNNCSNNFRYFKMY